MRICFDCGYRGRERTCPRDGLPTFEEDGQYTQISPADDLAGRIFADRYEVVHELGAGGMGAVYLARHRAMQRDIALKVLHRASATDQKAIKRFFREARLSAQLDHPNIIRVYDFGASEDGRLFLAMELLKGRTVREALLEDGPFAPLRAVNIARQICSALDAAHEAGVVHRDLKPDNIFLLPQKNGEEHVKVVDFGIAKPVRQESSGAVSELTGTGLMVGTPKYMSPEQVQAMKVDGRSDLYALGVVFYEMLMGAAPFSAPTPMALLIRQVNEPPPPLPERVEDRVIPLTLRQLVMWLLEKKAKDRPQTAIEIEEALARIGKGGALLADDDRTVSMKASDLGIPIASGEHPVGSTTNTTAQTVRRGRRTAMWAGFGGGVVAAIAVAAALLGSGPSNADTSDEDETPAGIASPDEPAPGAVAVTPPSSVDEPDASSPTEDVVGASVAADDVVGQDSTGGEPSAGPDVVEDEPGDTVSELAAEPDTTAPNARPVVTRKPPRPPTSTLRTDGRKKPTTKTDKKPPADKPPVKVNYDL